MRRVRLEESFPGTRAGRRTRRGLRRHGRTLAHRPAHDSGIISATTLTPASGPEHSDAAVGIDLLARDQSRPCATAETQDETVAEVLADSAYGTRDVLAALAAARYRAVIKPWPLRPPVEGGFSIDDFTVDGTADLATCPNGLTATITTNRYVIFGAWCRGCPLAVRCTISKTGRTLRLHPHRRTTQRSHRLAARAPRSSSSTAVTDRWSNAASPG